MRKESKNGEEIYPVYVHRRSGEVRRPWTGFSGKARFNSLLGELLRGMHGLFRGSGMAGKGSADRSTVAGDRVAAGTPFARQMSMISGSGEVESARRGTIDVYGGFIGAGATTAPARLWRDAGHAGACFGELRVCRTRGSLLLFVFYPLLSCQNVRILP